MLSLMHKVFMDGLDLGLRWDNEVQGSRVDKQMFNRKTLSYDCPVLSSGSV